MDLMSIWAFPKLAQQLLGGEWYVVASLTALAVRSIAAAGQFVLAVRGSAPPPPRRVLDSILAEDRSNFRVCVCF